MIPCANELAGKFGRDAAARMERTLQELPLAAGDADALRRRIGDAAEKQFRRLLFAVRDEAGASAFRQCLDAIGKLYEMCIRDSNNAVVPEAREALDKFKMEAASEVGVNLKQGYNGNLTSREAGSIGGQMVKKMIEEYERNMK